MSFVHAIPLALLIALPLIPLALHLLTRQRLRTIELSTYRFLFDSYVQQRRRTQFLEALLAILRMLFILGLLALIARPVAKRVSGLFPGGSGRDVILLVDCSASMNAQAKGQSAFDRAKESANAVVAKLSPDDRVTLVRVTGQPEEIFSRFSTEVTDLQDRVEGLQTSPSRANLFAALTGIFGDERKRPANPLVYFITDAQAGSFQEIERQKQVAERLLPQGTPFILVDVGSKESRSNLAVIGNPPPRQRAIAGLPVELQARVVNASNEPADATLTFLINDKEVERQSLKLKPNETVTRKMSPYVPTEAGVLRGRFEVSPTRGTDAFPDDDRFQFTLHVEPKLKVLIINGAPNADPFENETLYLRAALSAERTTAKSDAPDPTREIAQALDVTEELESAWAGLDEARLKVKLDDYAVVILANAGTLHTVSGYSYPALRSYVQDGGGLIVLPGDKVDPNVYNTSFFPTPPPLKDRITPVQMGPAEGDPDKSATFRRLARIDFDHPIFAAFHPSAQPDARYFDRVVIKKRFALSVPAGRNATVLAEYADRSPALVESRFGDGKVILASFPTNAKWTNLPLNGVEFVPLMLQMVNYAQRRSDAEGPDVVAADDPATFSVANVWAPVAGTVIDPQGVKSDLTFERFGGRAEAVFDGTRSRGYYTADIHGSRGDRRSASLSFAVNLAPEESDTMRITEDRVRELLPSAAVTVVDQSAEAKQDAELDTTNELWRYVIYVLFAVIAFELLLATVVGGGGAKRA
jgi:von Willebrand factor type A domain/Aerotolerance regulator N-terminal